MAKFSFWGRPCRYLFRFSIIIQISCDRPTCASGAKRPFQAAGQCGRTIASERRSEEHTSELQSLMRISYAVFCLKKKKRIRKKTRRIINKHQTHKAKQQHTR